MIESELVDHPAVEVDADVADRGWLALRDGVAPKEWRDMHVMR